MGNGDDAAVWKSIDGLREDVKKIAVNGCAHKTAHDGFLIEIRSERKERLDMRNELIDEMRKIRNQMVFSVVMAMLVALVIDKILK